MRTSLLFVCSALLSVVLVAGCSGTDDPPTTDSATPADLGGDTGLASDIGPQDAASVDASGDQDLGAVGDASTDDAGGDSGTDAGRPPAMCVARPGLGDSCEDTAGGAPCPAGFDCDLGRCIPQDGITCGGFAGTPCTDSVRNQCIYQSGHGDVGTCFSADEVRCLCMIDPTRWTCG